MKLKRNEFKVVHSGRKKQHADSERTPVKDMGICQMWKISHSHRDGGGGAGGVKGDL